MDINTIISLASLIVSMVAPFIAAAKATGRFEARLEKVEKDIEEIKISQKELVAKIGTVRNELLTRIDELSNKIDNVRDRLSHLEGRYEAHWQIYRTINLTNHEAINHLGSTDSKS